MIELIKEFYQSHWILTILIALPLAGALVAYLSGESHAKWAALWIGVAEVVLALPLFVLHVPGGTCKMNTLQRSAMPGVSAWTPTDVAMTNCAEAAWFRDWGIFYRVGLDGISLFMVLLTALLLPLMVLGSWTYIRDRQRGFYASLLALTSGVVGVFVALDMFLFYVFWEMMLIPMYFMIGIWGGKERIYAAVKFFLYTTVGSLLMLVGILYMWYKSWESVDFSPSLASFSYFDLSALSFTPGQQTWLFLAFALAFAIKVPIFPFHTWLPHAHVQAPTAGSVILAGVLLKMGTYGFIRFALPFFPDTAGRGDIVFWAMLLGLMGITYAALVAAVQPNAKKLVAYTSVAHLGFVILGIFAFNLQGMQGALLVMISHGLSTPMLFFMLGMLYERRHSYEISDFGGLAASMPIFSALLVFAAMASVGLPGTAGFVSEFLILVGTFRSHPWFAFAAATGVIVAAYYMLPMVQRMLFNREPSPENAHVPDLSGRELAILLPLAALIIILGVYPQPVLDRMEPAARATLEKAGAQRIQQAPGGFAAHP
jgi:NADH-quinone oxidoreductase subunit M